MALMVEPINIIKKLFYCFQYIKHLMGELKKCYQQVHAYAEILKLN